MEQDEKRELQKAFTDRGNILLQLLTAAKAIVISVTASCAAGEAGEKEGRLSAEKINGASLHENVPTKVNTFVADIHTTKPRSEVLYLMVLFAAERAASIYGTAYLLVL